LALQASGKLDRGMYERFREVQLMAKRQDLTSPVTRADSANAVRQRPPSEGRSA
jgi:hypothetical protein